MDGYVVVLTTLEAPESSAVFPIPHAEVLAQGGNTARVFAPVVDPACTETPLARLVGMVLGTAAAVDPPGFVLREGELALTVKRTVTKEGGKGKAAQANPEEVTLEFGIIRRNESNTAPRTGKDALRNPAHAHTVTEELDKLTPTLISSREAAEREAAKGS